MSPITAPQIDKRSAADVARQLANLLRLYVPDWDETDASGAPTGLSAALIGVTARFSEIVIERLNQVPQKNFLAFLRLLGAAPLPPAPARVPVTFLLAQGSLADAVVPAGTQVAAPPAPGDSAPVIYETESELLVTPAYLVAAWTRDPDADLYADYTNAVLTAPGSSASVFHGNTPIAHVLYIGSDRILQATGISNLSLAFDLKTPAGDAIGIQWEIWDGANWNDITPAAAQDGTKQFRQSGIIQFGAIPPVVPTLAGPLSKAWIRCRLLTPVTQWTTPRGGMVRSALLPQVRQVGIRAHLHQEGLPVDAAYANTGAIDLSKDFYPFGEKPRFNDALWLALEQGFSNPGATVTLNVRVTSPPGSNNQNPLPARAYPDLKLRWEVWNGAWVELGTSTPAGPQATTVNGNPFADTTKALVQNGIVSFTLPPKVARFEVNGKNSFWIRVRIISGTYGLEGHYVAKPPGPAGGDTTYTFVLPDFQPPSISSLTVMYDLDTPPTGQPPAPPEALVTYNDSEWWDASAANVAGSGFYPFRASRDSRPTFYLAFGLPAGRTAFPNSPITLFFEAPSPRYGEKTAPLSPDRSRAAADPGSTATHRLFLTNPGVAAAAYLVNVTGANWPMVVSSVIGNISFVLALPATVSVPAGTSLEVEVAVTVPAGASFGDSDRAIFELTDAAQSVHTAGLSTFAHQAPPQTEQLQITWEYWSGRQWSPVVVRDETDNLTTTGIVEFLPPPDIAPRVAFGTAGWWLRARWDSGDYDSDPLIDRILLNTTMAAQTVTARDEVLGSSDGSANQTFRTTRAPVLAGQMLEVREPSAPSGTVTQLPPGFTASGGSWVEWMEVPDFYGSGNQSRHYTVDHMTGQITFGDGIYGAIPPVGIANIRMAVYKTGGGTRGNRPAGAVVQLKTTVPYVDKVVNNAAASGGAEAESPDQLALRAPSELRHRNRAVTAEDYEDLVRQNFAAVARALCVPNRDLEADLLDQSPPVLGDVSVIIVPDSADPAPKPDRELLREVSLMLGRSSPVTATVHVVGPAYVRIDVQAEIGLASLDGAGVVARKVQDAVAAFLHPLTGGFDQAGWAFGREPHRSDLYTVVAELPEVDHIRSLTLQVTEDMPGIRQTGRFLVYSGSHRIQLVLDAS